MTSEVGTGDILLTSVLLLICPIYPFGVSQNKFSLEHRFYNLLNESCFLNSSDNEYPICMFEIGIVFKI
jgi:hypothetical protein